jgi:hypothetical protein
VYKFLGGINLSLAIGTIGYVVLRFIMNYLAL